MLVTDGNAAWRDGSSVVPGLTHPLTESRKDVLSAGQNQCMSSARKFRLGFYIRKTHNLGFFLGGGSGTGVLTATNFT